MKYSPAPVVVPAAVEIEIVAMTVVVLRVDSDKAVMSGSSPFRARMGLGHVQTTQIIYIVPAFTSEQVAFRYGISWTSTSSPSYINIFHTQCNINP
jgi:hypothetical protein